MPAPPIKSSTLLSGCSRCSRSPSDCALSTTKGRAALDGARCVVVVGCDCANALMMSAPMKSDAPMMCLIFINIMRSPLLAPHEARRQTLVSFVSSRLLAARFQTATALIEAGLHGDDAELPVFNFAVRGHHPDEVDRVAGHRHVRVKTFRHDHRIAVAHDADE